MGDSEKSSPLACPGCSYDLRGLPSRMPRCPECGRPFTLSDLLRARAAEWRALGRARVLFLCSPLIGGAAAWATVFIGLPLLSPIAYLLPVWAAATLSLRFEVADEFERRRGSGALAGLAYATAYSALLGVPLFFLYMLLTQQS